MRAVEILLGKTRATIERPINFIYPIESDVDKVPTNIAVEVPVVETNTDPIQSKRSRRQAAIAGEIRRKFSAPCA